MNYAVDDLLLANKWPKSKPTKPYNIGEPVITDERRKVAALTSDPHNALRHSEAQVSRIAQVIERFGFIEKLAIRPNGRVIGGHARRSAQAPRPRGRRVRVIADRGRLQGTRARAQPYSRKLALDIEILRGVILEIQEDGENALSLGFSQNELSRILGGPDDLEVKEIETGPVDDEFWISIRGPLVQQANALKALEAAMKPFAGVTVEHGRSVLDDERSTSGSYDRAMAR